MAQVDLEALEAEAKSKASRAVEYVRTIHVDPPRFSLLTGLVFFVIWAVLTFGWGEYRAYQTGAKWRAKIYAASTTVRVAIEKANGDLPDDEIIKSLEESDAALSAAETALRQKPAPATDRCPVLPRECLFKR